MDGQGTDAVVLAGGRSRRMGTDKTRLLLDGSTLLEHALAACEGARRIVVVGPWAPPGVPRTREDPPWGGPVAALAAGLTALGPDPAPGLLLLACDHPRVRDAVPELYAARGRSGGADGWVALDPGGHRQPLLGLYRRAALDRALAGLGDPGGQSLRRLIAGLELDGVPLGAELTADVDDPAAAAAYGIHLD